MSDPSHQQSIPIAETGSFRDRHGRVYVTGDAVYRGLSERALGDWDALRETRFFQRALTTRSVIHTEALTAAPFPDGRIEDRWAGYLKHQRIPFVSYPYEWCFGMLRDAALLHLDLLMESLGEDMTMKDASSFNVQWFGSSPVFIDVASFERLTPGAPWAGYRQFCSLFLYPLMLQAYRNVSFQPWLRGNIEGIDPVEFRRLFAFRDALRPGILMDVLVQAKLQSRYAGSTAKVRDDLRRSGFHKEMIAANLRRLRKIVSGLRWKQPGSTWSDYATDNSYSATDGGRKEAFVRQVVAARHRKLVWDLGCNTGVYSHIASENADYVVAMDSDHLAVERMYRSLRSDRRETILPLVINVANTSPGQGWRGSERRTLEDRGKPDLVLALALLHHIVISANVPLDAFLDWLGSLGSDVVVEFVTKDDPMTKRLLQNKEDQYADYTLPNLEQSLQKSFRIARREELASGTRFLYYAESLAHR